MRLLSLFNRFLCAGSQKRFSSTKEFPQKIFSGIQPTGVIHLGNYLGAVAKWVELQAAGEDVTYCIVDLHSLTLPQDPKKLSRNILEMTAVLLACGIDPHKSVLFQQSSVAQHSELCWYLSCICTMARLAHLPQYKEKSAALKDVPLGLFVYPVLQAADIMLHKATHVPVGEDQVQHLQLAQELARMFNKRFGPTFPGVKAVVAEDQSNRIRSLRDPTKKMSKSDVDPRSRICLDDLPDEIVAKIKKAVTDCTSQVTYDPESRPGVSNLVTIHSMLTNKTVHEIVREVESFDTLKYKHHVADVIISYLSPIQRRISDYLSDSAYLNQVLEDGGERAGAVAEKTISEVRHKLGINRSGWAGQRETRVEN